MANYLVIVESPAKANTIKKYLGKNYSVEASMGHLRDLPKSQMGVDLENDFQPKYITIRGKGDLLSKLKKQAKAANKVYLATDPDREGEAISWHLAKALDIDQGSPCRISFNEITKSAVQAAVKSPRAIDIDLVDAQQARRILDRIVGYRISPLLWKKVRKGLSAGRVQSVATRLIVDREREIELFIPREYWSITANMMDKPRGVKFDAKFYGKGNKRMDLPDEDTVKSILRELKNAQYKVGKVKNQPRPKSPAPPFITSTLQQEASRQLGFTSKRTMAAAQALYEGVDVEGEGRIGLITYMRTDSLRISAEAQDAARGFITGRYGREYLPSSARIYKSRGNAQDAHEAIRPTSMELPPEKVKPSLTSDQFKLYRLIWARFIASQMADAIYDTMSADILANEYVFKFSGSKVKFLGYAVLYEEASDTEDEDKPKPKLPELVEGNAAALEGLSEKQHFTEPPPRYSEASLIKTMEENGIGRPSTYAPTITTITTRGYVTREKKTLYPTDLGKIITDLMKKYFEEIVDVDFTANMENELDKVEDGELPWVQLIREFYTPFKVTMEKAEDDIGDLEIKDEVSDVVCEKCSRNMVIKHGRFGKFLACPGFPDCRNAKPIVEETGVACPKCGGMIIRRKSQRGKVYFNCEKAPDCDLVLWYEPTDKKCEACGSIMVQRGKNVVCSNSECASKKKAAGRKAAK